MGSGASQNYSDISPLSNVGFWSVHRARHKITNFPVSLWQIDYMMLKKNEKNKKERRHLLQHIASSVSQMSKISHPNILKIYEISSQVNKSFSFAAEPISVLVSQESHFTSDEAMYALQQIAHLLRFLHNDLRLTLVGVVPDAFVFSDSFQIKLCSFARAVTTPNEASAINDPIGKVFKFPPCFTPPEVFFKQQVSANIDAFLFAILAIRVYTGESPISSESYSLDDAIEAISNKMPLESADTLKQCISSNPASRPTFNLICSSPMFSNNVVCKVLLDFDSISTNEDLMKDQDKVESLIKNVYTNIHRFSERMKRMKLFPFFLNVALQNIELAPICIRCIFEATKNISNNEFSNTVMEKIKPLLSLKKPAKIGITFLNYIDFIMERIPLDRLSEYIQPIIMNAITSDDNELLSCGLKSIGVAIALVDKEALNSQILPQMLKVLNKIDVPKDAVSIINALKASLNSVGTTFIVNSIFPALKKLWMTNSWISTASPIADLIEDFGSRGGEEVEMRVCAPLALEISANQSVDPVTQIRLLDYVSSLCSRIKDGRNLVHKAEEQQQTFFLPLPSHNRNRSAPANSNSGNDQEFPLQNNQNNQFFTSVCANNPKKFVLENDNNENPSQLLNLQYPSQTPLAKGKFGSAYDSNFELHNKRQLSIRKPQYDSIPVNARKSWNSDNPEPPLNVQNQQLQNNLPSNQKELNSPQKLPNFQYVPSIQSMQNVSNIPKIQNQSKARSFSNIQNVGIPQNNSNISFGWSQTIQQNIPISPDNSKSDFQNQYQSAIHVTKPSFQSNFQQAVPSQNNIIPISNQIPSTSCLYQPSNDTSFYPNDPKTIIEERLLDNSPH